jgi:hypothetical protein
MMTENTKRQISMYVLGLRELPEHTPKHIQEAALASRLFFRCLNDETSSHEDVMRALGAKHSAARNFVIIEETHWLW